MSAEERLKLLQMAKELDEMDRGLPSGEASFLDKVLKALNAHQALMPKEAKRLEALHRKHLVDAEESARKEDDDAPPFDRHDEGAAGDADVDPDDFV